jgi:hypothetical protein
VVTETFGLAVLQYRARGGRLYQLAVAHNVSPSLFSATLSDARCCGRPSRRTDRVDVGPSARRGVRRGGRGGVVNPATVTSIARADDTPRIDDVPLTPRQAAIVRVLVPIIVDKIREEAVAARTPADRRPE